MYLFCYKNELNFKLRSKADVKKFLTKMWISGDKTIIVEPHKAIKLEMHINRETQEKTRTVSIKVGNLYDVFNPDFQLTPEMAVDEVYKYRKVFNERLFG